MATAQTEQIQQAPGLLDDAESRAANWYLFAIAGVVSVVIGTLVLAYPDPSIKLIGVFLGIDLLLVGAILIVQGATRDTSGALAEVVLGILALVAGLIVVRNPDESLTLMVLAFAIYLIVRGAVLVAHGLATRAHRGASLVSGLLMAIGGTVIISWPDISLTTLTVLAGITLILQGAVETVAAFRLRGDRPAPLH